MVSARNITIDIHRLYMVVRTLHILRYINYDVIIYKYDFVCFFCPIYTHTHIYIYWSSADGSIYLCLSWGFPLPIVAQLGVPKIAGFNIRAAGGCFSLFYHGQKIYSLYSSSYWPSYLILMQMVNPYGTTGIMRLTSSTTSQLDLEI